MDIVRVSTQEQSVESQKNVISRYCIEQKLMVDEWIALEMSSRKFTAQHCIDELLNKLSSQDAAIASELSRLGRSIRKTLQTVETILKDKNNAANKVLITVFFMLAELERDFISERTKEGLKDRASEAIKLGKLKGVTQASMYDKDREKILHLYQLGVLPSKIINTHLNYGKITSPATHIQKRITI